MTYDIEDPGVWQRQGTLAGADWSSNGGEDFGWGTVPTKRQQLTISGDLKVYKLVRGVPDPAEDNYLLAGNVFHGIMGSPNDPAANWVSVGFYANYHSLKISCTTPGAKIVEFGPNSTVEQVSVSFSIGGSIGGTAGADSTGPMGEGSLEVNTSVGVSFTSESVRFAARPSLTSMEWRVDLPGVGFVSPAVPANPFRASYAGYIWNPALICKVPAGSPLGVSADLTVDFEYNWTRGITARRFTQTVQRTWPPPGEADALTGAPVEGTIVETLRSLCTAGPGAPGRADTFVAALDTEGLIDGFGDSHLSTLLVVPTNEAIKEHMENDPETALQSGGPLSRRWVTRWLEEHMVNKKQISPDAGDLLKAAGDGVPPGEYFPCSDGGIYLTDVFTGRDEVQAVVAAVEG
jgi:hypothetical protein